MSTDEPDSAPAPIDAVMEDIRAEIVRRAVLRDMDEHRDVYDALADE